jgi:hypothetical protein
MITSFLAGVKILENGADVFKSKDRLAEEWIAANVPNPSGYTATLATLTNDITGWSNRCGDHVHLANGLYSRANGRSICQSKIELLYAEQLAAGKADELFDVNKLKNQSGNGMLYAIIALVVIVMVIIVLIIKM